MTWNGEQSHFSGEPDGHQKKPRIRGDKLQNRIAMTRSNNIRADLAPMPWIAVGKNIQIDVHPHRLFTRSSGDSSF